LHATAGDFSWFYMILRHIQSSICWRLFMILRHIHKNYRIRLFMNLSSWTNRPTSLYFPWISHRYYIWIHHLNHYGNFPTWIFFFLYKKERMNSWLNDFVLRQDGHSLICLLKFWHLTIELLFFKFIFSISPLNQCN
jgi:hypothetical protein